jgi:hypothetical protein
MEANRAESLDCAAETFDRMIALMQDCGYAETAQFLAMAKCQFLIESNGITDEEFRAFCDRLEGKQPPEHRDTTPARTRRDGTLRAMRRAWQCPQDVPAGRGRRRVAAGRT